MRDTRRGQFADVILYMMAAVLVATSALGIRDVLADPSSPARLDRATRHLLTPLPDFLLGLVGETRVLLVGADDRSSRGRADTIIVAHINAKTRRAALLSIQRDTLVDIPGHGRDKVNHAYKFGGVPLLRETLQPLLGEELDRYAKLDFDTFKEAIDRLDGVVIAVPDVEGNGRGMNYDDNADGLHIHLPPGEQKLDGYAAMGYVRYRRDNDLERAGRQRRFLKAIRRQHLQARQLPKDARRCAAHRRPN